MNALQFQAFGISPDDQFGHRFVIVRVASRPGSEIAHACVNPGDIELSEESVRRNRDGRRYLSNGRIQRERD